VPLATKADANEGVEVKTKTIRQQVTFKGTTPHELYEWLMDSKKHSQFTGQKAVISRKVGGRFKAGDGWIDGMNLELAKDKLIVQGWRESEIGDDWPNGYYSVVRFRFTKVRGGTRLDFLHSGVPAPAYEGIRNGWREYYWEPLKLAIQK
jgi:activator of HSP90 ATPase